MKINFNPISNVSNSAIDKSDKNSNCVVSKENKNATNLSNMPSYRHMVRFRAKNDNVELLHNAYSNGRGMPITYDRATSQLTSEERLKLTDVYAHYKSVYADMENCHTVEELKTNFPEEFSKLESALTRKDSKGSFLTELNRWAKLMIDDGMYLFPETKDNDLSVYLAKKIFFEAKTKKEIEEDIQKDVNSLIQNEIKTLGTARKKTDDDKIVPDSVYGQLGLIGDLKSNGFRHSLSCSRESYIAKYGSVYRSKRVESFNRNVDEVTGVVKPQKSAAPKKNTTKYEKSQYAMFYAWNKSLPLRHALSDFLIMHKEDNELLKPDFMDLNPNVKSEDAKKENQKSIMSKFWDSNPELRADFKEKCNEGFDKVEQAIDNGTFEELKKEISSEREEVYKILKEEKAAKEALIAAEKFLQEIENIEKMRLQEIERQKQERIKSCSDIISRNMKIFIEKNPVPRSEIGKTTTQLQNLFSDADKMTNDEVLETAKKGFVALHKKVDVSVNKTFGQIIRENFKNISNNAISEIIKQYPQYASQKDFDIVKVILQDEMSKACFTYQTQVFVPYLCCLSQHSTGEISKVQKKEILNNLYNTSKESDSYNKEVNTNARKRIFDDLHKVFLNDVSAKGIFDMYKKSFATTPLELENS